MLQAKDMPLFAGAVEATTGLANVCKATQGLLASTTGEVQAGEDPQRGRHRAILQRVGGSDRQVRHHNNQPWRATWSQRVPLTFCICVGTGQR